jgi:4-methyl-5(b-hydroxyethyl)-thiazole monophosphate biosynthesis
MPDVLVPLAQGCEELEAVTVIDLLRRAGIEVTTAGLDEGPVTARRGTVIVPDTSLEDALQRQYDMIVLPGGIPGADHLEHDPRIRERVRQMAEEGRYTAAICAAPKVLAASGVLEGKRATSFPGILESLEQATVEIRREPVVVDGTVVTSRGPGTAMDFALELITILCGRDTRDEVEAGLQRP